ncbi:hypothetical protein B0T26DRAFT_728225 [Lasiosphaeria miniovina]|uniref:Low temperature requirement A n=1 Tax=Lasiosphaeria miniovina TaxID=1954250 RepID=A0AA40A043_9PEZI|nr:uncharacterized protein B0T26DRAFT_728225 [Lasiosphaeria miniovina]KAK0706827.1 hypothetical protein B0T26DRAFT_728225 [Lasiosphaeria miniovina]
MSFELFFDLLYVGIIAINGDHAAEEANGHELLRFAVTFAMSWKIWSDVQQLVSWFETNDVAQRVEMLVLIACLLGQTTNMLQAFAPDPAEDTFTQLVGFYLAARLFSAAYCALTAYLVPLVRGMMAAQVAGVLVGAALWIASVHAYTQGQAQTEQQPPDGESHGDESQHGSDAEFPRQRVGLVFAALAVDLFLSSAAPVWFFTWARKRTATREEDTPPLARRINRFFEFFPAINIEHRVERTNAFVTLVLGYSVVGVVFQNAAGGNSSAVLNAFLGKAVLGLVQAYVFNWLYFEVDGGGLRTHAIRRSVVSASLWQYSHLAFIMAYILAAAALSKLVVVADCANAPLDALTEFYQERSAPSVSLGLRLYYCVGLGTALLAMGAISLSHEHRGPASGGARCRLPKWARLANRGAVCVVFFCLSAATGLDSLGLVATTTGLSVWTLLFELWGKSCPSDSLFVGGCTEYTALCGRRTLHEATRSDGKVDIAGLGRAEKTAVLDHV